MKTAKTKDKVQDIIKFHSMGYTNNQIAEAVGEQSPSVRYWLKKLNLTCNPEFKPPSEELKQKIISLYAENQNAKLTAELCGVTHWTALKCLKDEGVDTSARFFKGEEENLAIEMYNSGKTQEEVAEHFGCERQAVQSLFERKGIKGRSQLEQKQITWHINQKAFTDWTNEADLFFYGLLLSDGCITDKSTVSITLQQRDMHILEDFNKYLERSIPLRIHRKSEINPKWQDVAILSFGDVIVSNNLRKVGMESRKSANEAMPTFDISDLEIARHFWRGFICGDGSVRSYKSNGRESRKAPSLHVCGSEEICQGFADFCKQVIGREHNIEVKKYNDPRRAKPLYYFRVGGRIARDVSVFMFDNCTYYINRKKEDVEKFKEWNPTPKNGAYGITKSYGTYKVTFFLDNKQHKMGTFETLEEAIRFRLDLEMKYYGYHKSLS